MTDVTPAVHCVSSAQLSQRVNFIVIKKEHSL